MSWGAYAVFSGTFASAGTLTSALDLGRSWNKLYIDTGGNSAQTLYLQASQTESGTYRNVYQTDGNAAPALWQYDASTDGVVQAPGGVRYVKVASETALVDGGSIAILASD